MQIDFLRDGIVFVVAQRVGTRNEFVLDVLHLLLHGFDRFEQFGIGIGLAVFLFRLFWALFTILSFFSLLLRARRHGLAAAQHARDHIKLLPHPFEFVGGFGSLRNVVANTQLQLERRRQFLVARAGIRVFHKSQRLRESLTVHGKPNRIFSWQRHGTDFGFANPPVQNLARIASAKAALFPDMRIFRRSSAQRNEFWRIVKEIPLRTVYAHPARWIQLSNHGSVRIENLHFGRSLGRSFQRIGDGRSAVRKNTKRIARSK